MGYNKRNDEINALTKESVAMAYYELLQNKSNISISMICEAAGVSRNAYYRNFTSTDDIIIYALILKWAQYCDTNPIPPNDGEAVKQQLIRFFYTEKDFIRAVKAHKKVYLIEEVFRKTIIPAEDIGMTKYALYVVAYAVYGMIRAMIDNDFAETPEQIIEMSNKNK